MTEVLPDNLEKFSTIGLYEMGSVFLQNRVDKKFVFPVAKLNELLKGLDLNYRILEINKKRTHSYQTSYFDTPARDLYKWHHNGRGNRYKLRLRHYETGEIFFEIKCKTNKDRTTKHRFRIYQEDDLYKPEFSEFLKCYTGKTINDFHPLLKVGYQRITLIKKDMSEKITIDTGLNFAGNTLHFGIPTLVVAEVKQQKKSPSFFLDKLKTHKLAETAFSKYIAGMIFTEPHLKSNAFKTLKRKLNTNKHDY
jgi:hypothetical protein